MIRRVNVVMVGLMSMMVVFGCSRQDDADVSGERVFVKVNDRQLTESGLRELVPSGFYDALTPEQKREIVNEWVNTELLYQEAIDRKLDQDPDILKIIENTRRTLLVNELLERNAGELKPPADDVLKKYYEDHKQYFMLQEKEYRIRYASFDTRRDSDDFRREVKSRIGFSELAKEKSKDPSSENGGDLGVVTEDAVSPEVWKAIDATVRRYGLVKVSDPFQVSEGWACLIVDEAYEPGSVKPFESVKDRVLDMYMTESRETARAEFLRKLSADAKITYENDSEGGN